MGVELTLLYSSGGGVDVIILVTNYDSTYVVSMGSSQSLLFFYENWNIMVAFHKFDLIFQ